MADTATRKKTSKNKEIVNKKKINENASYRKRLEDSAVVINITGRMFVFTSRTFQQLFPFAKTHREPVPLPPSLNYASHTPVDW